MPIAPPISDRALKYGRNVMATSGVVIVLGWVPGIGIERFKPFGFDFSDGGTLVVWCVLCAVLFYYFISFVINAGIDIHLWMDDPGGLKAQFQGTTAIHRPPFSGPVVGQNLRFTKWRMWFDVGTPTVMFIVAMAAAMPRIVDLWPTCANGI